MLTKMSKTFLGDIERAKKAPTTVSLEKIAKALGVKPSLLLEPEAYRHVSYKIIFEIFSKILDFAIFIAYVRRDFDGHLLGKYEL